MIIEIKIANYRSIHAEQTLSFVADSARRHPNNLIQRPGYRLLKAVGLFGANASGKSNFVRAIGEMTAFVHDSATKMNDGDPIECAQPYRLDPESRDKPSRFEVTFVIDSTVYTYGFAATHRRVYHEWLKASQEKGEKKLFNLTRNYNPTDDLNDWTYNGLSYDICSLLEARTRDNALFLSTAARENVTELLPAYRFISGEMQSYNLTVDLTILQMLLVDSCEEHPQIWNQVEAIVRDADASINQIDLTSTGTETKPKAWLLGKRVFYGHEASAYRIRNPKTSNQLSTSHRDTNGEIVKFSFDHDESSGTQRLFILAFLLVDVLQDGGFLILDEINTSMHPVLMRKLLEMFQSFPANPKGAQLLFTNHDPSLLDQDLFRRDQVWLAEKRGGASTFFSLADIDPPIRSTESFLRNYLAGRYGGTPHLGRTFEELEIAPAP